MSKIDNTIEVKLVDNSGIIRKAFKKREDAILDALGVQGSDNVFRKITAAGAVDTGLMRNSVTWAVSGGNAAKESYRGDKKSQYRPNDPIPEGKYSGTVPDAPSGQKAVYIGSNVEYFPMQELGYHRPDGTSVAGIHALRDGVNELQGAQAEHIAKTVLRNAEG